MHPSPLYEIGFDAVLFFVLFRMRDRLRVRGSLFRLYLLGYASFRCLSEFFRGDSPASGPLGLKPIQVFLLIVTVIYALVLWRREIRQSPPINDSARS